MSLLSPGFCWEQTVEVGSCAAGCDSSPREETITVYCDSYGAVSSRRAMAGQDP